MIYFENTQDPQRVRIMRDTPNPGAVPTPGVEYSAGTNIDITANVISVTGLTNYSAGTGIDIQDGVISATGATPVGYSAGTNIDITEGVISVTGIEGTYVTSGDVKDQIESYDYATESQIPDVSEFVTSGDVKSQIEGYDYATKGDVTAATSGCQETLVSGTNIRTINGNSILGSGDLVITGGEAISGGDNISIDNGVVSVTGITSYPGYSAISGDVATQIDEAVSGITGGTTYQAGSNIDITNDTISVTGVTSYPGYSAISGDVQTQIEETVDPDVVILLSTFASPLFADPQKVTIWYEDSAGNKLGDLSYDSNENRYAATGLSLPYGIYAIRATVEGTGEYTVWKNGELITTSTLENVYLADSYPNPYYVVSPGNDYSVSYPISEISVKNNDGQVIYNIGYEERLIPIYYGSRNIVINQVSPGSQYYNIELTGITSYPGYSGISGDVATQIENAVSGITGGTSYTAGTNIDITNDTISVTGITSFPGFSAMTKDDVTNALGYKPTSSGSVKTQIEAYNYVTSGDVATQVETYHYTTSGDVQSQITGATGLQETLVSGQNIKTVNSNSLLGSGDVEVGDVRGNGVTGLWTGTQAQYDAITAKSNTILYFIHE